jgi:hypothetical protein
MKSIRTVSHHRPRFVRDYELSCTNNINIATAQIYEVGIIMSSYECYVCYCQFSGVYLKYTTPAFPNESK